MPLRLIALACVLCAACYTRPSDDGAADGATGSTGAATGGSGPTSMSGADGSATEPCTDECPTPAATCVDGDAQTCELGAGGCLVLTTTPCDTGCEGGRCTGSQCGDGTVAAGEACDDGNEAGGDGCSAGCEVEAGWTCDNAEPSVCGAPDLSVRIVAAAWSNNNLDVTYVVENVGGAATGPYQGQLWATITDPWDNPPRVGDPGGLPTPDRASLDPGDSEMFTDTFPNAPMGTHVAFVMLDPGDQIIEEDEVNNVGLGFGWTNGLNTVHASAGTTQGPTAIPDNDMGGAQVALDLNVVHTLPQLWVSANITHPDTSELELRVVHPNEMTFALVDPAFTTGPNFESTTFSAQAVVPISDGTAPYAGHFTPADPPASTNINGSWRLEVVDHVAGNEGRINYFTITVFEFDP